MGIHYHQPLKWAAIEPLALEEEGNRSVASDRQQPRKNKHTRKGVAAEKLRWNFLLQLRLGGVSHWGNDTRRCPVQEKGHNRGSLGKNNTELMAVKRKSS